MSHSLNPKNFHASSAGLIIFKIANKKLSKNQEAFNKLTKRIEILQKDIEKKTIQLDNALQLFGADIYNTELLLTQYRLDLIVLLWTNFNKKKLAKADQNNLKQLIREHVQYYLAELRNEPDEEIKKIFNFLEYQDYDEALNTELERARQQFLGELKKMKVDLTDVNINDVNTLRDKYFETRRTILFQQEAETKGHQKNAKEKSFKHVEAERMLQESADLMQKILGTVYKQLAKLFHPDLEQDMDKKLERRF